MHWIHVATARTRLSLFTGKYRTCKDKCAHDGRCSAASTSENSYKAVLFHLFLSEGQPLETVLVVVRHDFFACGWLLVGTYKEIEEHREKM